MSRQGTWCDALIIQGVAESMNLVIHIVESHRARTIFIGHTEEYHYVSTVQASG